MTLRSFITRIIRLARAIIYPNRCAGCGRDTSTAADTHICNQCRTRIPESAFMICPECKKRVVLGKRGGIGPHRACQMRAPYFLISPAWYGDPIVRNIIHSYKYRWFLRLRKPLGHGLARAILSASVPELSTYSIVPVPLHSAKLRTRGFNQSEELAIIVSSELGLPVDAGMLSRVRFTPPQAKIKSREERRESVRNAFRVTEPRNVAGQRVLLIDDVTTSGATLGEAARALKAAGAKIVVAATIARS